MISSHFLTKQTQKNAGFGLGQLLVVMAISTTILSSVIVQQGKWNDQLAVSTQAYELALMFRQAQNFGLGVREYSGVASPGDKFDIAYGIYLNYATPDRYIFFADRNKNGRYDVSPSEAIETKMLNKGVSINTFCSYQKNPATSLRCAHQGFGIYFNRTSITFERPTPSASFLTLNSINYDTSSIWQPLVIVCLRSASGREYSVTVDGGGQVATKQYTTTTCPN